MERIVVNNAMQNIYLDTASLGLLQQETVDAATKFTQDLATGNITRQTLSGLVHLARKSVRTYVGATSGLISFIPPFGYGLLQIASSLRQGRNVLVLSDDYPSFKGVWAGVGHKVTVYNKPLEAPLDIAEFFDALKKNKIEIVTISHVNYRSGRITELDAIDNFCTVNGILLIVDGTQSLGLLPIDLSGDHGYILLASCYKWLCAGFGLGIRYISPVAKEILQKMALFAGVGFEREEDAEISHYNYDALVRLQASISIINKMGATAIYQKASSLAQELAAQLENSSHKLLLPRHEINAGIVSIIEQPGVANFLLKNNICIAPKEGIIRISPHWYNTADDIRKIVEVLNDFQT